ncbi:SMI1/KNR4 family protein [Microbacterium sp. NPDC078428]|uniref:SMI1/KNR4 family protein n=1 Tax=Microbacterium sp. NPDC078428 TaxID=3364190 RepID=UPI0037C75CD6
MTQGQLEHLTGVILGAPADEVTLAVADALLPTPVPPVLRAFLTICDGAKAGGIEVFSAERITEMTNRGAHTWQLPPDALIIGMAGAGRALVMMNGRDEVCEVDDDPWDSRTMEVAADTPLDLFVRHRGLPLRDRPLWSALPGLGAALDAIRTSAERDVEALLDVGIASRVGTLLPASLRGFRQVGVPSGARLLASEEFQMFLVNDRPDAPAPGPLAAREWERACESIVSAQHRNRIRMSPVSAVIEAIDSLRDGELTAADIVRDLAWLALLGKARHELALLLGGDDRRGDAPVQQLARVFLAGHVPVGLDVTM